MIIAFFPCVRFEDQILLHFRGQSYGLKNSTMKQKMEYCMQLMQETHRNYDLVNKMFLVCMDRGLRLVMENPYSEQHFLRRYWCYPATIIDKDRRNDGDYYAKPTQYWFLNFNPKNNILFEPIEYNDLGVKDAIRTITKKDYEKIGAKNKTVARSMIHPTYANRFIRKYLIEEEEVSG